MGKILEPKVQATGLLDIALMGVSKSTTENLLTPIIGNGTFMSGGLKLIGGGFVQGQMGKMGKTIGAGLIIDGIDDLVSAGMQKIGMAGTQQTAESWWT